MRSTILVTSAMLALLAACSSSSDRLRSVDEPCTNDATIEAIRSGNQTTTHPLLTEGPSAEGTLPPFQFADDETECRLRRVLLKQDDLPSGWAPGGIWDTFSDRIYADQPSGECGVPFAGLVSGLRASFEPEGAGDDSSVLLAQTVLAFTPGQAANYLEALRHSCREDPGSDDYPYAFALIEDPRVGDGSLGYRQDFEETTWVNFVARRGDVVTTVGIIDGDPSLAERMVGRATDRMDLVGDLPDFEPFEGEGCAPARTPAAAGLEPVLEQALLSLADVGRGWVEYSPGTCGFHLDGEGFCEGSQAPSALDRRLASVQTAYQGTRRALWQDIAAFQRPDAVEFMDDIRLRVGHANDCPAELDGERFTWAYQPLPSLTPRGDEVIAWRVSSRGYPGAPNRQEVAINAALLRRGGVVMMLVYSENWPVLPVSDEVLQLQMEELDAILLSADRLLNSIIGDLPADVSGDQTGRRMR
jgi:hypothetical protein